MKPIVKKVVMESGRNIYNKKYRYWRHKTIGQNNTIIECSKSFDNKTECRKIAQALATQLGVKLEVKK